MYGSLFYVLPILAVIAKTVFRAVLPLLIGCMIAYVVNILMCFYEKGYARICRMAAIAPLQRPLCMTLSYLSLVLVILILWWMIVPQLLSCIRIIATDFPQVLELLCEWANEHLQMDLGMGNEIRAWMNEPFCWDTLIVKIPRLAKGMKTSLEKLGSWLLIFLPGLMFSFYLLAAKESLLRMGSSLIDRCFGVFQGKKIRYVLTVLNQSFHHFLAGQTIEAVILGMLCTIGMWILRLPYAAMIGCLVGVTALLPVIGAYIGAAAGACMLLTVSGKSTGISYLFNNSPADRRQFYLSPCGRTFHRAARHLGTCRSHCRRWGIRYLGILFAVPLAAAIYRLLRPQSIKPCSKLHGFLKISRNQIELTLSVFFKLNGTSSCVAGLLRSIMPNNRSILFLAIFSYP